VTRLHKISGEELEGVELYRDMVIRVCDDGFGKDHALWEEHGFVPTNAWRDAGANGLLCVELEEAHGGQGGNFLHAAALIEVLADRGLSGPLYSFMVHSDIVVPYIRDYASTAVRSTWLPRLASGQAISAIAMTEAGAGSDLKAMATTALPHRDGGFLINGAKTFITNGGVADLIVVCAKTSPDKGARGMSLFAVDANTPGLRRGRNFEKLGMRACNTAELFFDDMHVPASALMGERDHGFGYLMKQLPRERLVIAIAALATAESILRQTVGYVKQRKVFGQPLSDFQNTAFTLADFKGQLMIARIFLDECIQRQAVNELDAMTAAIAKQQITDLLGRLVDACVQLHGGYGYMWEQPVTRAYADARVLRIFGGANEVMKDIVSRQLFA
jgi:alkylation response protein AidB-like acyl-CoA dehydrogenase